MIESVRTPEPRVQGQRIYLNCDFCVKTSNEGKSGVSASTSNEFLTRSNVNQHRVPHSFCRTPRSFQIQSNESHTRVDELRARSRFATPRTRSTEDRQPSCSASTTTMSTVGERTRLCFFPANFMSSTYTDKNNPFSR